MGFRFRQSFKILPGVRVNLGKRGVSVSAGVRGAHVTLGRSGTRATAGIPGTGLSYSTKLRHTEMKGTSGRPSSARFVLFLLVAAPAIGFVISVLRDFQDWLPTALGSIVIVVMVAAVAKGLRDRAASDSANSMGPAEDAAKETQTHPARQEHKQPRAYPRTAESLRKEAQRALEAAAHEQERLAQALGRYRCFYKHGDEMIGPVTVWNVRELVETELLNPDVQVILEGSDYWFSYAEQELRIAPPPGAEREKLRVAAKIQCSYLDKGRVCGPLSLLGIFHLIRSGRLAPDVQVRADGSAEWKSACEI